MINADNEVSLSYLLDPAFELVNTAGKPLTDGYIEVYIHGTRNKYYCASDFDGTLHPFKIPLDALGANIVLASPAHSYDVYVYNKFGSLVMSRYNIQPKTGSGEIVHDDITVSSNDGSVQIVTSGQTNYDLSIQDTVDRVDVVESSITNLATSIEEITNVVTAHDVDIEELKANKKDKQEEYVAVGGPTKTITKVEQDEDGKMTVTYEDIDLPQEVPNVEITSPNGTINIASSIDVATNTKTFEIDVDGHEPDWHYWTGNNAWTTITNGDWKDINRPTMGAGKYPHSWTPEVKLGVYDAKADFTVTFHNPDNSYTVPNQIIQIGFRAKLVGKHNADAIRYVDLGAWTYDPSLYTTEPYQFNFAQESLRQNYSTSKILYVPAYVGDTEFYIYYQAALLNTDGSQNVTAIDPVCRAEITYFGYHEVVGSITGTASGGTTLYAGSGIDIDEDRINVNIGEGLTIVNNNVSIDKSVVLAKDNLVAGDNITITASGDNLIISSDADVSELATKDELASAVDNLQDQIDNIPEQVQSDWTEADVDDPAYIQHKPDLSEFATKTELGSAIDVLQAEINDIPTPIAYTGASGVNVDNDTISLDNPIGVLAGDGITFTASGDDIIISANADTSNLATKDELASAVNEIGSAIDDLQDQIDNIPAQVQSDWTEADVDDPAYIQHKPIEKALVAGENITITDIGSAIEISSTGGGASGTTYTAGDGIDITNDVISVDNSIARTADLDNLATKSELGSAIDELQDEINNIPTPTTYTGASGVNVDNDTISLDDPIGVIAGEGITFTASGDDIIISATGGGGSQVQADWTEDDSSDPSYIQNKPTEKNLVAGTNVTITETNDDVIVNTTEIASGAELVAGDGIEITASGDDIIISSSSSGGASYTAGVGITIDNDVLNVDTSVIAPISAIPADKVIKVDFGTYGNTFTVNEFKNWWQSGKLVYLYVPESAYLPGNMPNGLMDYGPMYLQMTKVGEWEDEARFVGIVDNTEWNNRYIVQLDYNAYEVEHWTGTYIKLVTESDIPSTASFATKTELATAVDFVEAEIPANTSDLNNDSGFITTSDLTDLATKTELATAIDAVEADIPSATSDLQNDSGFITSSAIPDLNDLNTAGITDIQVVNALPASPVATVLYLVRE